MNHDTRLPISLYQHYLQQLKKLLLLVEDHFPEPSAILNARLAEDMLRFADQVRIAIQFSLRACCPYTGAKLISFEQGDSSFAGLNLQLDRTLQHLQQLATNNTVTDEQTTLHDRAGDAEISLPRDLFVYHYSLPNFFFHYNMIYAIARHCGVPLSKGDYDGFHRYPKSNF